LYDVSGLNVSNVIDCVKDGEAINYQFMRHGAIYSWRHSSFVGGAEPVLKSIHCLKINERIDYKLLSLS